MTHLAAVVLAAVLLLAGAAKLRDREHVVTAIGSLRLPKQHAGLLAIVAPIAEIVLAVALLATSGWLRVASAVLVLGVMVGYTAIIVRALGFEHPVTCSCFGKIGAGEVTRGTAIRNLTFVVLALLVLVGPHQLSTLRALIEFQFGGAVVVLLALVAGFLSAGGGKPAATPIHHHGAAHEHHGPDPDANLIPTLAANDAEGLWPFPAARLTKSDGREVVATSLLGTRPAIFFNFEWTCEPCRRMLQALPAWAASMPDLRVYCVVPLLDINTPPRLAYPLEPLFDLRGEFGAQMPNATPAAILIGADGLVAAGPFVGSDEIRPLLDEISESLGGIPVGEFVPCETCG